MRHTVTFISCLLFSSSAVLAQQHSWASLPISVPNALSDDGWNYGTLPTLLGTPPQEVNLTINLSGDLFAAFSYDCVLCAGNSFFDASLSTTFQPSNTPWPNSDATMSGIEVNDTVSFGGLLNLPNEKFALMESMSPSFGLSLFNGHFGVMMSPVNTTEQSQHILSQLLQSNQLLNPVVGMRFDPKNPKMTIGALDPADYEGEINWVEMETPVNSWDFPNVFKLDGIKGYNGSFLPWGNNLSASVNSLFFAVAVPNTWQYMVEDGFTGPLETISYNPDVGVISYQCNETTPYVALTATINGVDYRMDSPNNLLRPTGESRVGFCNVGITNRTQPVNIPDVDLGLPFLRSVYLAYRFPTANCPGYYGFAFPSGANRTQAEISQTPTSTPTQSAQCLSLTKPTSTPTATVVTARQKLMSKQNYDVYMNPQANQMPLAGVDELPKAVWNTTDLNGP